VTDNIRILQEVFYMRLFIAVNFSDQIKNHLYEISQRLKNASVQGNFTRRENFHLTVVFIGETTKISSVKQAMNRVSAEPFRLTLGGLGKFHRRGGDIYWIGVEHNISLTKVYNQLCGELAGAGFAVEKRGFKPHLTLGRKVILNDSFDKNQFSMTIPPMSMEVVRISLMKSERINEKLTYTEIYTKEFL
jgi:2'-5' RNA ligase